MLLSKHRTFGAGERGWGWGGVGGGTVNGAMHCKRGCGIHSAF